MRHRVLVVEDDEAVLEVVELMLSEKYELVMATNGEEAVRMYKVTSPDLVLMDVVMPGVDGVQATKEIKKLDPSAKIIGITAYAAQRGKELLDAGALEIIEKPFTRSKLIAKIEKYLE